MAVGSTYCEAGWMALALGRNAKISVTIHEKIRVRSIMRGTLFPLLFANLKLMMNGSAAKSIADMIKKVNMAAP
ncbi:MAG: hypothetical protein GY702_22800 [Desulfobulbaceae bacterium]|nr:hypothetical protein [Desulfobulbaceae bacterium]